MPRVSFTPNIQRHVDCPSSDVVGETVREVLENLFAEKTRARGYVLDDQGVLRQYMVVFVDGKPVQDRKELSDQVSPDSEIYIMQALSGG